MSSTKYLKVSGKAFRATLTLLCADPAAFSRGPFGQPEALQRLLGDRHAELIENGLKPVEQAVQGLEWLALRLMIKAIDSGDLHLAEGLIMVWHQYLEPIGSGSARAVAPVGKVLRYSAEAAHLAQIADMARDELGLSAEQAAVLAKAVGKLFLDVRGATPNDSAERAYINYLHRALETLATEPELDGLLDVQGRLVKTERQAESANGAAGAQEREALTPGATAAMAAAGTSRLDPLEPLAVNVKHRCASVPTACGLQLPITQAIPRRLAVRTIRGTLALPQPDHPPAEDRPLASLVLAGGPGSGRTTWLRRLAYGCAEAWQPGAPLAVYIPAADFLPFARNRRSLAAFAARVVYPDIAAGRAERADLIQALEQSNEDGRVLWLVDDLDRLPPADQAEVLGQLALAPAVIMASTPWEADQVAAAMPQPQLAVATLENLTPAEQEHLAAVLLAAAQPSSLSLPRLRWALAEVPYLARRPLGVAAVATQVAACDSHRVAIVRRALTDGLERAGRPALTWSSDWSAQSPLARALLSLARASAMRQLESAEPRGFSLRQVCQIAGPDIWEDVERTRLLEPGPAGDGLIFNPDVLACLAVQAEPMRANWHLDGPGCQSPDFAESLHRYLGALWELAGR
ncbi:MAG: hypothetical protein JNK29_19975 [Anaerolineales bacterium]|nr:hypothetical protein [Anaerolineales bacterium]